ncbi:P-loop containing nucleoside triphosphate hydrolase protein [Gorgonomyces haynaldii]|nr:P-loop containing nucleoside triphosphate hydrolase protein [Gorgonomyces haynaldii]
MPAVQTVKVAVRVRNLPSWHGRGESEKTTEQYNANIVQVDQKDAQTGLCQHLVIGSDEERKEFSFDYVYSPDNGQEDVYNSLVVPLVDRCMTGFNGCIFAYGQTASGKTFTMGGAMTPDEKDRGIIPRVARQITQFIEKNGRKDLGKAGFDYQVTASYLEIYNEQLRDLLLEPNEKQQSLKIRSDPVSITGKDLYVQGLTQKQVRTEKEYLQVVEQGAAQRKVAETNMNAVSSRSHSVLTLTIVSREFLDDGKEGIKKRSKIHLIDLAGSERANSTGATGERLKEGAAINQSLSCLGNVINALTTGSQHIPYRDSQLTYLLSDSLGGNSLTAIIACVTPIAGAYEESVSTLRFAERAKKIKNKAILNVDANTLRIMALEAENLELKQKLSKCKCGIVVGDTSPQLKHEMSEKLKTLLKKEEISPRQSAVAPLPEPEVQTKESVKKDALPPIKQEPVKTVQIEQQDETVIQVEPQYALAMRPGQVSPEQPKRRITKNHNKTTIWDDDEFEYEGDQDDDYLLYKQYMEKSLLYHIPMNQAKWQRCLITFVWIVLALIAGVVIGYICFSAPTWIEDADLVRVNLIIKQLQRSTSVQATKNSDQTYALSSAIPSTSGYALARVDGIILDVKSVMVSSRFLNASDVEFNPGFLQFGVSGAQRSLSGYTDTLTTYDAMSVQFSRFYSLKAFCKTNSSLIYTTPDGIKTTSLSSQLPSDYGYYPAMMPVGAPVLKQTLLGDFRLDSDLYLQMDPTVGVYCYQQPTDAAKVPLFDARYAPPGPNFALTSIPMIANRQSSCKASAFLISSDQTLNQTAIDYTAAQVGLYCYSGTGKSHDGSICWCVCVSKTIWTAWTDWIER